MSRRVGDLAVELPEEPVYHHIGTDTESAIGWPEIHRRSSQLAGELGRRGVGMGDRVALGIRNSPQLLFSVLATWKVGATPVTVRWDLPEWELRRLLEVIDARLYLAADDLSWIDATAQCEVPELPDVVAPSLSGICSSGSTGLPKVILSGRPALYDPGFGEPIIEAWRPARRPQRILVPAPMYHTNGFATLLSLLAGDRLFVLEKFDAARAVDVIERHQISTFTATPTMLKRIADLPGIGDRDLSSIDWIIQGAAPMPPYLVHRWAQLIGAERIVMAYGMTEGLGTTALRGDEWMAHEGSVGRPIRDTEIRIVGPGGATLPPGETGEIYLRSPLGGYHYLGTVPALPETEDGFRSVGDMGYLDGDGFLYMVDRRVDLIVSGGANVYPAEVEIALIDHPKIADVVVVGLRDDQWGRRVHAIIQPADPANPPEAGEVREYAKGRLAAYKVPKTIEVVDAIPRSEATKINRRSLIEARGG